MELAEIVNEIIRRGMTQERLAAVLKTRQGKISEMASSTPKSTWAKHWRILFRLVQVCRDLGIDPAQDLKQVGAELGHAAIDKTTSGAEPEAEGASKARTPRRLPPRRASRH